MAPRRGRVAGLARGGGRPASHGRDWLARRSTYRRPKQFICREKRVAAGSPRGGWRLTEGWLIARRKQRREGGRRLKRRGGSRLLASPSARVAVGSRCGPWAGGRRWPIRGRSGSTLGAARRLVACPRPRGGWPLAHARPPAAPALRPGRAPAWRSPKLRLRRGGGRLLTIRPLPPVPRASWRRRLGGPPGR